MRVPGVGDVVRHLRETGPGRHGAGIDDAELTRLERELGVSLPPGYRSFLRDLGWLSAPGVEVLGAGEDAPPEIDLRAMTAAVRRDGVPPHLIPFARDAAGTISFLDTSHSGPYESPVYRWRPSAPAEPEYAGHDFASWLWMRLAEASEERPEL